MRISPSKSGRKHEQGIIITLVAVFMLFVVGAMAALSIDVITFYTARSEAQIAADSAALAAARVLANSGMTSSTGGASYTFPIGKAEALAKAIAIQVAQQNPVGGNIPTTSQITVSFSNDSPTAPNNPIVTVKVTGTLPTFFARIWGPTMVTVSASATAEAYNPSGLATSSGSSVVPVAPSCVKPWLLPNIDPCPPSFCSLNVSGTIFDLATGAISDPDLLGQDIVAVNPPPPGVRLNVACSGPGGSGDCSPPLPAPTPWQYFPGDPGTFGPPSSTSVSCSGSAGFTPYQLSVAGCVQAPIACNATNVAIDLSSYTTRNAETTAAVDCLTLHSSLFVAGAGGDKVDTVNSPPFEFLAGDQNPMVPNPLPAGTDVLTSDSLVTVPVFNSTPGVNVTSPVQIIGFLQLFLQPTGSRVPASGIRTTVINMVGCGTNLSNSTAVPVYGNGPSAVPVRLISPPAPAN